MRVVDTFMFSDELDMLECRLVEIGDIVDHFVLVEADVTHSGKPKAFHYDENAERFEAWHDKIVHVKATGLPTGPDAWVRERGQREYAMEACKSLGLDADDLVLHGDVDEIPRPLQLRNMKAGQPIVFGMRMHPFAVDWIHPEMWRGTVAAAWSRVRVIGSFSDVRDLRFFGPCPPHMRDAGWHFSWVGGNDYARNKLDSFAHTEIVKRTGPRLANDEYRIEGRHVDGVKLEPVEVDKTWPKWVRDGHCPSDWFRPR